MADTHHQPEPTVYRVDEPDIEHEVLATGTLTITGRIMPASNGTYFAEAASQALGGQAFRLSCVYKPLAGERPLWDFPHGTLAGREYAAYLVSQASGWNIVPPTTLREGPLGAGMVQAWREADDDSLGWGAIDLVPQGDVPDGFLAVLDAEDGRGRPITLVHQDCAPLRRMAIFDVIVNNADRKGGHILAMGDGHRYGVDHGICLHEDDKLRTVLWGWADSVLEPQELDVVVALGRSAAHGELADALAPHLTRHEIQAVAHRCGSLARSRRLPVPRGPWPAIPWPAF